MGGLTMTTSTEFFINMPKIPTPESKEYDAFFQQELKKLEEGVTVNGIYYSPWLYWHLNHWTILIDKKIPGKSKPKRIAAHPHLRDNEWIIAENIMKAEKLKKGLLIVGSRRFAKTEIGASTIAHSSIINFGSENLYSSSNDPDLNKISACLKRGYKALHPYFKPVFMEDSWGAGNDVVLGFKDSKGERYEYSRLLIRNHAGGKNTEGGAGATLSSALIDEIGKSDWLEFLEGMLPALESEFGWRCSPIATGTTGNMQKAKELMEVYKSMEDYNFLKIELKDDKGKMYSFFPGMMSLKFPKKTIPLAEFTGIQCNNTDTIKVTQWDRAYKALDERQSFLRSKNKFKSLIKLQMYYPKTEDEMFLTDDTDNPFADVVPFAKEHLDYLNTVGVKEEYGFMVRNDEGKPVFKITDKLPIQFFPALGDEDKDAPIIIWEHPIPGAEFGILYVGGSDPYNQDESFYSTSLGTLYIYKRTYDPLNGTHQESFVASYAARPKNIGKWREQMRLLLEYYGATCLPESEEPSLIRWFDEKNIGYYLEDSVILAKEISPNSKAATTRNKGLAATEANIRFGNGLLRNYCLDDLIVGQTAEGDNIIKKGIIRIKDRLLLQEIIDYKPGMNVDRIVGARHALILAHFKNKYAPIAKVTPPQQDRPEKKKTIRTPFLGGHRGSAFGKNRKGPFR